ncbi:MAG: hypothetical protein IPH13_17420 [Planctomycetes bacterium]|nr:hypothetical protein [Planctomycetota bacterium]MCC7170076.1 hypothetical protein [Planctomycetota bacterium]
MLASLLLVCAALFDDVSLVTATFDSGLEPFVLEKGTARAHEGACEIDEATLESTVAIAGDVTIEWRMATSLAQQRGATLAFGDLVCGLDGGQVTLTQGATRIATGAAPGDARTLRLVVRSNAVEAVVNDVGVAFARTAIPFSGGALTLGATQARVDAIVVTRRAWFDDVRVEPVGAFDRARFVDADPSAFELVGTSPTRIDPIYELREKSGATGLRVSFCGVRPDESEVPLVEQALAFAQLRPRWAFRVLQGDPLTAGPPLTTDTTAVPAAALAYVECDVLIGVLAHPPTMSVYDVASGELIDRSWVGGPPGRPLATRVPEACTALKYVLVIPGRSAIERIVNLTRS